MDWKVYLRGVLRGRGLRVAATAGVAALALGAMVQGLAYDDGDSGGGNAINYWGSGSAGSGGSSNGEGDAGGGDDEEIEPIASLKTVPIPAPEPQELAPILADRKAAIQLGKALFWDTRVGSDNRMACASCHFSAGSDSRSKNQLQPGLIGNDKTFQLGGPNYQLKASDFPFTRFADLNDASTRNADVNDVVGSQGVFTERFNDLGARGKRDGCIPESDAVMHGGSGFNLNGVNTRRVEPRNTPTVINAVFNLRLFWDGRANNMFNGVDVFGLRNQGAAAWKLENGVPRQVPLTISSAALASQASGPPLSENEMSCRGRAFAQLGRKLLNQPILADQTIHDNDSVLGRYSDYRPTYAELVRRAFKRDFWASERLVRVDGIVPPRSVDLPPSLPDQSPAASNQSPQQTTSQLFTQMEANFALFFGLAVQMYESTLVSDDTPFDRFAEGDKRALTAQQRRGLAIFRGPKAQCVHCHSGAEFTSASFTSIEDEGRLDSRVGPGNQVFRYDNGFFNTGVRPTAEDPGVGGVDPFGNPLSDTRMAKLGLYHLFGNDFDIRLEDPVAPDALEAVQGTFKTPSLRNVELTGPYFHNGGKATLMQVVDLYNRGGDFGADNQPIPDPTIRPLGLSEQDKKDLVAFMLALTDERVRFQKAPFDHPSICIVDGHVGDHRAVQNAGNGNAVDIRRCLPAVGANGSRTPLQPFLGLNPFQH